MYFPATEYEARVERAQSLMHRQAIDALVLTSQPNFGYFSGWDNLSQPWAVPTRLLAIIIPRNGMPVLIVPEIFGVHAPADTWVEDVRMYTRIDRVDVELIAGTIEGLGLANKRLGFEMGMELRVNMPPAEFDDLRGALHSAEVVDAAPLIWELRRVKSPAEIKELKRSAGAAGSALIALFSGDRLGWSERDAVRFCNSVAFQTGADDAGFNAVTSGRGDYNRGLAGARDRRLDNGDMLWIDFGVTCAGYWSDICRAGVVGGPTGEQNRLQQMVVEATWAGIEQIRPGVPIADVARTVFAKRDEIPGTSPIVIGRSGHSIGLRVTEIPHASLSDATILEPGMVITVEPFVFDEVGLYCAEETVVVTEDGHDVISFAPRELATI